ncbi:hypothetical protein BXP70_26145 [Hymenobacter crusticola]|uniref:Uncharacterized protein n=1 Tax=Hymenobacter crusticola TaxID=1770526 RepID=A0A243W8J0_9BACT|nr:hypothetical protein BXP70_26145 [Hymenobacter crusticola]
MYRIILLLGFFCSLEIVQSRAQNPPDNASRYESTLYRAVRSDIVQRLHFDVPRTKSQDPERSRVYLFQTPEGYFLKEFILHQALSLEHPRLSEYAVVALSSPKVRRQLDALFQRLLCIPWEDRIPGRYPPSRLVDTLLKPVYHSPWRLKVVHNDTPRIAKNIEQLPTLSLDELRRRALLARLRTVLAPYLH